MRVLVTGASGFVGREVVARLHAIPGCTVRAAVRGTHPPSPTGVEVVRVAGLAPDASWSGALAGCRAVVHAAARVHVMQDSAADPLEEFRLVNVAGTMNLARQAAAAGVGRFVFLSSIKVNGERTPPGRPFTAADAPAPEDAYGISKLEAEEALRALARESGLEVAVVRPVLVYGPGVKANFRTMMTWLARGVPLPLGAVHNRRSLVAVENLADLVASCVVHPAAAGQTFLVSDGDDVSTPELLRRTASALGVRARLIPVPASLLRLAAGIAGRGGAADRLLGSLTVDTTKTSVLLGWAPPARMAAALARAARHYQSE